MFEFEFLASLYVLDQEAMKIVVDVRIRHFLDDGESILDALGHYNPKKLFHYLVVRLRLKIEDNFVGFVLLDRMLLMDHLLCGNFFIRFKGFVYRLFLARVSSRKFLLPLGHMRPQITKLFFRSLEFGSFFKK